MAFQGRIWLLIIAGVVLLSTSLASAGVTIPIRADNRTQTVVLTGQQGHDIWREVYHPRTCWERDWVGHHTECYTVIDEICQIDPATGHRVCRSFPRTVCREVDDYIDRPYECGYYSRERVGYEVDNDLEATIHVQVEIVGDLDPNEAITFSVTDDQSVDVVAKATQTSKNFLIFADLTRTSSKFIRERLKQDEIEARIKVVDISKIREAFARGFFNMRAEVMRFEFDLLNMPFLERAQFKMRIERVVNLWPDKTLFDGEVPERALVLTHPGDQIHGEVLMDRLNMGNTLQRNKKYKFTLGVELSPGDIGGLGCLNPEDVKGKFSMARTLKGQPY